ncbi:MAG: GDSL-type esterase/lipase family protein [Schaedlerella sp.]|nr:GDSL-type esterase/lipase family protein [Schaedlerella sp.]
MDNKGKEIQIRWLLIGIGILVAVILAAEGISTLGNQKIDTTEGLEVIKKAETADITVIENKIEGLETSTGKVDEEPVDTRSIKEKFGSSVVMGDSIALGFSEYDILNPSSVVAEIGARIGNEENIKIQISKAKEMNPQMLFLYYGINDLHDSDITKKEFLKGYKDIIDYIQEELPNTKIFVNSILPVSDSLEEENPRLAEITEFNAGIREICDKEQIAFLDNTDLVTEYYYEEDGIHLIPEFYDIWAGKIAEVAEL